MQESPFYGLLGMIYDEDGGTVSRTHKKVGLLSIARRDVAALHEKEWTSRVSSLNGFTLVFSRGQKELGIREAPQSTCLEPQEFHHSTIFNS